MCIQFDAETDDVSRPSQHDHGVPLPSHQAWLSTIRCLKAHLNPCLLSLRGMYLRLEVPCTNLRLWMAVDPDVERQLSTFTLTRSLHSTQKV